jgi:Fe-Mn family superoxide dismutase
MKRREFLTVAAGYAGVMLARAEVVPPPPAGAAATGAFALPPLPYAEHALEPFISARTIGFHYGKHHKTYVDNLNKFTAGTDLAALPLEAVVQKTAGVMEKAAVFNNAAQAWNHAFFWKSMKPGGGGKPDGKMLARLEKAFGSFEAFRKSFVDTGLAQFGSGWVWLVSEGDDLKVVKTANADTPLVHGQKPLLTCDVWEHAYYLDYQNRRKDFVETFVDHLANWACAAEQL